MPASPRAAPLAAAPATGVIGIDVGGTFIDVLRIGPDGTLASSKLPATGGGVAAALAAGCGVDPQPGDEWKDLYKYTPRGVE